MRYSVHRLFCLPWFCGAFMDAIMSCEKFFLGTMDIWNLPGYHGGMERSS